MYELLLTRKTQLDQIVEGLSSLGFIDFLGTFTEELSNLFVGGENKTTTDDLLSLITIVPLIPEHGAAANVKELNENGESFVTILLILVVCL